jgi:hypothetical protein
LAMIIILMMRPGRSRNRAAASTYCHRAGRYWHGVRDLRNPPR